MNLKKSIIGATIITVLSLYANNIQAYDTEKLHPAINYWALGASSELARYLQISGFSNDIDSIVNGVPLYQWFSDGGKLEDAPICRTRYHFHDPLEGFESAGLSSPVIDTSCLNWSDYSSLVWAQLRNIADIITEAL